MSESTFLMRYSHTDNVIERPKDSITAEIAVIGSGPGGATTASVLAEAGQDVLLLEEGPYIYDDMANCPPFSLKEMVMKYRNGGVTVALGKPKVIYAEGKCVGGGSEINGGLWHRTPDYILEEWREAYSVEALLEKDLRPHFEQCEKDLCVSLVQTGHPPASLRLLEGAQKLNWQAIEVPKCFSLDDGVSVRQSMTKTLIPYALNNGLRLIPNTRVMHLEKTKGCWRITCRHSFGIGVLSSSKTIIIKAGHVFVAGGAIQTPALLKRSGINQNIGVNLRFHPAVKVVAKFADEVNGESMGIPVHQINHFAPRFVLGCSASTLPHLAVANAEHSGTLIDLENKWRYLAMYYAMIPGGRGRVTQLPVFKDPLVRYTLTDQDLNTISEGLKRLCQVLFAAGAEQLIPSIRGIPPLTSMKDLDSLPPTLGRISTSLTSVHLFSTCPMGENKERCAVNSFGKVHETQDLYVADASILCGPTGVNPQGSIMAVARRNAMHFLGKL